MRSGSVGGRVCGSLPSVVLAAAIAIAVGFTQPALAGPFPGVPDPGGDELGVVSVPPPGGKFFGYHENSAEYPTHAWSAADMAAVAAGGGANLHRFDLDWFVVEPSMDHWHENGWARYARMYSALQAKGIKPVITIGGVPPWARAPIGRLCGIGRGCEYPPAEWMDGEWAEFLAEVARRFPETAAIEIWNEPNIQGFWKPNPNPWRYAQLVAAGYPAIKAVNPNIRVLAGSMAPAQTRQTDLAGKVTRMPMKQFLDIAYAARPSIKGNMDAISFHTIFQTMDYGAETLYAKFFDDVRTITQRYNDAGRKLWISETGLTTQGEQALSENNQGLGLLLQYRRLMTMPDVEAMVIHTLAERVELPQSDFNRGYGLIRSWNPFTPKQAFCAFAGRMDTPTLYGGCPRIDEQPSGGEDACDRAKRLKHRLREVRRQAQRARAHGAWDRYYRLRARKDQIKGRYKAARTSCLP